MRHARTGTVVAALLLTVGLVPSAGLATHEATKPVETQYEFRVDLGDEVFGAENAHYPDREAGSLVLYLTGAPETFELSYLVAHSPLDTTGCEVTDIAAGGIDRGNDDRYTETDTSLIGAYEERGNTTSERGTLGPADDPGPIAPDEWDYRMRSWIDFWEDEDFGGDATRFDPGDEGIIALRDCVRGPSLPGWYRGWGTVNGTNPETGEEVTIRAFSNWNYVCECDSYDEAVETIGAPPAGYTVERGQTSGGGDEGASTPTATASPTPTATTAPTTEDDTATATRTPAASVTDTVDSPPATEGTPPTTADPTDAGTTDGNGPGPGVVTGMLGLLGAALLARRVG